MVMYLSQVYMYQVRIHHDVRKPTSIITVQYKNCTKKRNDCPTCHAIEQTVAILAPYLVTAATPRHYKIRRLEDGRPP